MVPSFADLGVPAPLCTTLARRGIADPFPIQAATLPDALSGRDVAGKAPTGSGKTLVFGLTIAARAATLGAPKPRRPRALVLVPTRELAAQVQRELTALIDERTAGPVVTVYGGVGYGPQRKALARGVAAVVACPGRLEDLVASGDVVLDRADLVVLDEADRMADMGFMPAVRRLLDTTPERRQTLLFSATLDGDVDKLVHHYQHDPVRHEVAGSEDDGLAVEHMFWTVPRDKRVAITADIVARTGSTIVFTRTRHGADRVARQLGQAGIKAVPIHGRRSQAQRDQALRQFSTGRTPALVATDVAARGIHVDDVASVVHFDLPDEAKDYVHRSGRTGRAGATGIVVALVPEDGRKAARILQRQLGLPEQMGDPDLGRLGEAPVVRPVPADTTPDWSPTETGNRPSRRPRPAGKPKAKFSANAPARSGGAGGGGAKAKPGGGKARRPGQGNGAGSGSGYGGQRHGRPGARHQRSGGERSGRTPGR